MPGSRCPCRQFESDPPSESKHLDYMLSHSSPLNSLQLRDGHLERGSCQDHSMRSEVVISIFWCSGFPFHNSTAPQSRTQSSRYHMLEVLYVHKLQVQDKPYTRRNLKSTFPRLTNNRGDTFHIQSHNMGNSNSTYLCYEPQQSLLGVCGLAQGENYSYRSISWPVHDSASFGEAPIIPFPLGWSPESGTSRIDE
jgi:hypothetical protein